MWRKCIPGSGNIKYKGPKAGVCLVYLRNMRMPVSMAVDRIREETAGDVGMGVG